jgi:hypothetical protein
MKKIALILAGLFVAVIATVAVIAIIGSQLPPAHVVSRSVVLRRSTSEIYSVIRAVDNSPSWRTDISRVEMLGEVNGRLRYMEHGSDGAVTYELVEDVPDQKVVTRIVDEGLGYSGSWSTELKQDGDKTLVTITENGEVSNVIFRFLSRYVFGHTSSIDNYLTSLAKHFGETVQLQ